MEERDKLEPRGAVLDPTAAARAFRIARIAPDAALAPFVRHYWFIRWDLAAPYTQSVLPLPTANAVIEEHTDAIGLALDHRFDRTLEGKGAVFGTLFRWTGLRAFVREGELPRGARVGSVLAGDVTPLRALAFGGASDAEIAAAHDRFWLAEAPVADPRAAEVESWMDLAEREPTLGRAELLADRVGVGLRTLERRLAEYVGHTPKQILRRFRLLEAAARLEEGGAIDHAALALSLGYSDQAHFVRDFAAVVGRPPGKYARAQRA